MGRRLATLLTICLVVPALAFAAAGDPKKRIAPADQKKAVSIVLKRADLAAGWKRVQTPDSDLKCPGFNPDESDLTLTGTSETEFRYSDGITYVGSASNVFVSTKDALASWTRGIKPALARCLAHFFRQGAPDGAKVAIVKQGRLAFPHVAQRTAAFRVLARVTVTRAGENETFPYAIHLLALGRGRGDVGLLAMAPGAGIPAAELRGFGKLLASRLQASGL